MYLISIQQRENEPLHDHERSICIFDQLVGLFMKRFNATTMITKGLSDDLTIQAFMAKTIYKFLLFHIINNPSSKLSQFNKMVHPFTEGDQIDIDRAKSATLVAVVTNLTSACPLATLPTSLSTSQLKDFTK